MHFYTVHFSRRVSEMLAQMESISDVFIASTNLMGVAVSTRAILLRHDELTQLEERIFGTDKWRSIAPRV